MSFKTYFKFLIGDRQAILDLARDPYSWLYGAVLVLSAGFAREYDWHYLVEEPQHLVKPFMGSMLVSFVIFISIVIAIGTKPKLPMGFWKSYRSFLGLFWLTAPFAWPYSIPYERFTTPLTTAKINLFTLLIVSILRVALMVRIVSVISNVNWKAALPQVMKICNVVALFAMWTLHTKIVGFMGGIHHLSDVDLLMKRIIGPMLNISLLGVPGWFIVSWVINSELKGQTKFMVESLSDKKPAIQKKFFAACLGCVLFWFIFLPFTQEEQKHSYIVYQHLIKGEIKKATAYMSQLELDDFPPHYDPYLNEKWIPRLDAVREYFNPEENKVWVNEVLAKKYRESLTRSTFDPNEVDLSFLGEYAREKDHRKKEAVKEE